MKFKKGKLIIEFYNEDTSDFMQRFTTITQNCIYYGPVANCNHYKNAVPALHKRCEEHFTHVKIYVT